MQLHNRLVEVNVSVKAERLGWSQEQTPISGDWDIRFRLILPYVGGRWWAQSGSADFAEADVQDALRFHPNATFDSRLLSTICL